MSQTCCTPVACLVATSKARGAQKELTDPLRGRAVGNRASRTQTLYCDQKTLRLHLPKPVFQKKTERLGCCRKYQDRNSIKKGTPFSMRVSRQRKVV